MRKGILLAGGSGSRLAPITRAVNKQLLPVFDKPLVYYPLNTLLLAGVRQILLITSPRDQQAFQQLLGDGHQLGIELHYATQSQPAGIAQGLQIARTFAAGDPLVLILGDNIFSGPRLPELLKEADGQRDGATIFATEVEHPQDYGIVDLDDNGRPTAIDEKPLNPRSRLAVPGLYFYDDQAVDIAAELTASARGELEITDVNRHYLEGSRLKVLRLDADYLWLDTGTPAALLEASSRIKQLQEQLGRLIGCIEETAFRLGYIDAQKLERLARPHANAYGEYLRKLV